MQKLKELAGMPEQGTEFVRLQLIHSLVSLLAHENTDIVATAVEVLEELTSEDVREETGGGAQMILDAVSEAGGVEHLAESLERFDESVAEEAMAVFHVLSTVENLVEIQADLAERFGQTASLLEWLVHRLQKQEFDSNKQYASEILAILLQSSVKNQLKFGEKNGIDLLLRAIAQYRNKEPENEDEAEMLENLFDALCSSLLTQENKAEFLKAEGIELMIILFKAKTKVHGGALKVLDYALTNNGDAVERFVERLGLRDIFKLFANGRGAGKGNDAVATELFQHLPLIVADFFGQFQVHNGTVASSIPFCSRRVHGFQVRPVASCTSKKTAKKRPRDARRSASSSSSRRRMDTSLFT
eukprot:jgi/Pico_ML_1/51115/g2200.t1